MRGMMAMYRGKRTLFSTLLALWLLVPAVAAQGLVYRIQNGDKPPSFLVGTMHSEDPRVIGLLKEFEPLIDRVDVVVVELVPDAVTMLAVVAATQLPGDQSLRGLIGDERFDALVEAAAGTGLPRAILDRLKPWAAAVALGMPTARTGRFLDMEIYLYALGRQKRVVGLETAAEQLAVFDQMGVDTQLLLLDEMVKNAQLVPKQLEELTAVYLAGDLGQIERVARSQFDTMPAPVMQWFDDRLLDRRNANMLERLVDLLRKDSVLAAVGAMHLAGETGLVRGLRQRGFRVEAWP